MCEAHDGKNKVVDLLGKIRCGAGYVPGKVVLDCLLEPLARLLDWI